MSGSYLASEARESTLPGGRRPFWVIGHRGSPIVEVENTLPSFARAMDDGANALELDVCVTRDRELVIWHDEDPNEATARFRQWGLEPYVSFRPRVPWMGAHRRPVSALTLAEMRRWYGYAEKRFMGRATPRAIATVPEFFEWATREPRLGLVFLDVKITKERMELVPALLERLCALRERLRPEFRIVLESCHAAVVEDIRRRAPEWDVCIDIEPHAGIVFDLDEASAVRAALRHRTRHAAAQKPRSITLWPFKTHRRIIERDIALLRRHNDRHPDRRLRLLSFLINEPEEMTALLDLGVSAIQTDKPWLLRRLAQERGILQPERVALG